MKLAHYHRFPFYDYSRGATLFASISTEPRRQLFGEVVAPGEMRLSPFGEEVLAAIEFTFAKAAGFLLFGHTVLPDHCHFRFYLEPGLDNAEAAARINSVVGRFKSYTTHLYQKKYGGFGALWQEGFHDWLCLSREMIDAVERYIAYNALKWWLRNGGGRALMALHEPLKSPRLGQSEYWRGLGAVELLGVGPHGGGPLQDETPATGAAQAATGAATAAAQAAGATGAGATAQATGATGAGATAQAAAQAAAQATGEEGRLMVSLRVSRRCSSRDVSEVVRRISAKAGEITIISGFISPGEREVLAALLANPAAKLIKVSPYALPHDYAPSVALMPAIAVGRLAIIARGNSPEEISRAACLDYNARIIDIADKAAYALPGELRWLK